MNNSSTELNEFLGHMVDLEVNMQQQVEEILAENENLIENLVHAYSLGFLFCFTERFIVEYYNPSNHSTLEKMMKMCFIKFFKPLDSANLLHQTNSEELGAFLFRMGKEAHEKGGVTKFNQGHLKAYLYPKGATAAFVSLPLWKTFIMHNLRSYDWD